MKLDTQLGHNGLGVVGNEAAAFERMGFDGAWTFEAGHDPFLPCTLAAHHTHRIHLGTNIAVAFARSPMSMAQVAWDLQQQSAGRFHLGLGTQVRAHVERRYSMPYEHPVARLVDYVDTVRAIWNTFQTNAKPAHEGPFYKFTLMNPMFTGGPIDHPRIPIWIAGVNPLISRAAGEVADGFHVHPMNTVAYLKDVVIPNVAEGEIARQLSVDAREGRWAEMPTRITDAIVDTVAIVAKPKDLARKIHERYDGILDRVSLYFPIRNAESAEETWKTFVAAFRG